MSDGYPNNAARRQGQHQRLLNILRRHVEAEDDALSDHALVEAVMVRYTHWRGVPLIDPNE